MSPTNVLEEGLESLIVASLTGLGNSAAGSCYVPGESRDFDRDYAVDLVKVLAFLRATQPETFEQLGLSAEGPRRQQFLARLQGEITRKGVVEILRNGIHHGPAKLTFSTALHHQEIQRQRSSFQPISSALLDNCTTAKMRPSEPSTFACS